MTPHDSRGSGQEGLATSRNPRQTQRAQTAEFSRLETALKHSEAFYYSLVESLPQNIFRKDLEGRHTFANSRYCQTLGLPLADILGKTNFSGS
jgi:PAS domain-containing protein